MTATAAARAGAVPRGFDHPALFYSGTAEYLAGTTDFVRTALHDGDAVLVAVPGRNLALLRDALADVAGRVTFADMVVAGRNPGRIIPGVLLAFAGAHSGRRVSIIGEPVWPGRTDLEYPACAAHEALINTVFAERNAAILCPYDAAGLSPPVLADAWRTHPVVLAAGGVQNSDRYTDPLVTAAGFNTALPPVPPDAHAMTYHDDLALAAIRRLVRRHATAAGLSGDRVEDLMLAANELTANTLEHTRAGGRITLWTEPEHVVCQVDDQGHLTDPLAGRIPPAPGAEGGRGLVLTNQLCDLVRIHTADEGTTIRLHMRRPTGPNGR